MSLVETNPAAKPGMRAKIVAEYATLFRTHDIDGPVLEIGSGVGTHAFATAPFLLGKECHVVVRGEDSQARGVHFHKGNPNDLTPLFDDACFGAVIWDRAIEGDRRFWLTSAEIRRVLAPGGKVVLCTRGFTKRNRFNVKVTSAKGEPLDLLTSTAAPATGRADHLRFSGQGLRRVVLQDFEVLETKASFLVPHLFAVARKPA